MAGSTRKEEAGKQVEEEGEEERSSRERSRACTEVVREEAGGQRLVECKEGRRWASERALVRVQELLWVLAWNAAARPDRALLLANRLSSLDVPDEGAEPLLAGAGGGKGAGDGRGRETTAGGCGA